MSRTTYCRCCGQNKGHNFDQCKNANAMRKIIKEQDQQLVSNMDKGSRITYLEKKIDEIEQGRDYLARALQAFVTLIENHAWGKQ